MSETAIADEIPYENANSNLTIKNESIHDAAAPQVPPNSAFRSPSSLSLSCSDLVAASGEKVDENTESFQDLLRRTLDENVALKEQMKKMEKQITLLHMKAEMKSGSHDDDDLKAMKSGRSTMKDQSHSSSWFSSRLFFQKWTRVKLEPSESSDLKTHSDADIEMQDVEELRSEVTNVFVIGDESDTHNNTEIPTKSYALVKKSSKENFQTDPDCVNHQQTIHSADDCTGYLHQTFWEQLKDRSSWLVGLLVLQSCSSFILKSNEELLQSHLEIVHFLTMLVGAGGNAGNQAGVRGKLR